MAFVFDTETNKITLPIGDTMTLNVRVNGEPFKDGDTVMFAVSDDDGNDVLCKSFEMAEGKCRVRLSSADTAKLETGGYTWNLRLVHTAEIVDGKVQVDDSDEVVTLWNKPPKFILIDGGCDV